MRGSKYKLKTARHADQILARLFGNMCTVIVQDHSDGCLFRIVTVQSLQVLNELSAAMSVCDHSVNVSIEQIDAGQQA